jgi:hypothetical protein
VELGNFARGGRQELADVGEDALNFFAAGLALFADDSLPARAATCSELSEAVDETGTVARKQENEKYTDENNIEEYRESDYESHGLGPALLLTPQYLRSSK